MPVTDTSHASATDSRSTAPASPAPRLLPGILVCLAAAAVALAVSRLVPSLSALIVAIIAGIVVANVAPRPAVLSAGLDFAAKKFLRAGIILLGLQLVLSDIIGLGAPMLLVIVAIVGGGILGTLLLGRLLRVSPRLTTLIACGFSICGAAAVAAASGVTDPEDEHEEDTVTAIALVVICGTAMIALVPLAATLFGLDAKTAGLWAGGSIHEIAQVVAAGGVIGGGALTVAVIVKLARVLMLAPVMIALSVRMRRAVPAENAAGSGAGPVSGARPPLVPLFVLGFFVMVLVRSFLPMPALLLEVGGLAQTILLAAAMFALGCGVQLRRLLRVGARPFVLAALSTLLVALIALGGVLLAS